MKSEATAILENSEKAMHNRKAENTKQKARRHAAAACSSQLRKGWQPESCAKVRKMAQRSAM